MYITGQRVKINEAGFIAYDECDANPKDVVGTVLGEDEYMDGWYVVAWDNGEENTYEVDTLDVVEG